MAKVRRNGWSLSGLLLVLGVGMWSGSVGPPSATDNWREDAGGRRFRVGKNGFFEFESGEAFYPIAAKNLAPHLASYGGQAAQADESFVTTFSLYLECLAKHGVNTLFVEEETDSLQAGRIQRKPAWTRLFFFRPGEQSMTYRERAIMILKQIGDNEATTGRPGTHSVRPRSVSVGNLLWFNSRDPDEGTPQRQTAYLDNLLNDYVDYHLYTWTGWDPSVWFTEYPDGPTTPVKFYLGVGVGAHEDLRTSGCTLPEIIDHNRYAPGGGHRLGGFFSSEFGLLAWEDPNNGRGYPRKRLINDCYHNYIWLGFATGSVGGPTPWRPAPSPARGYYDLSGINYLNPTGEALNYYTDEILDSMLSLSRFTSLVQWKLIDAPYRPVRLSNAGTSITLWSSQNGPTSLSQNDWLWSAASDGFFTVGWILRNCPRDYGTPEWDDALTTKPAPRVHITGLQALPLELVWFDDHLGQIVGSRAYSTSGTFNVVTPNTEGTNGFARSIAFLIQPTGLTPNKIFTALPDEKIGQIEVTPRDFSWWYEECQKTTGTAIAFKARTKPAITNAGNFKFRWNFHHASGWQVVLVDGSDQVIHTYTEDETDTHTVRVDILDKAQQDKRVSGDMIELWLLR